jgi:hypothetical protein
MYIIYVFVYEISYRSIFSVLMNRQYFFNTRSPGKQIFEEIYSILTMIKANLYNVLINN